MNIKKCFLTANRCYITGLKMTAGKPTGIVVHSTGVNNKTLKRYVQPLKTDANYAEVIEDIGRNLYGNHWNNKNKNVCVHAFIGANKAGEVETYQTLPWDICAWGVGKGKKGSYNYNPTARIQFEICEDNLKDEKYFNAAFDEAAELCAHLCKEYGLGVESICSHAESYKAGYGSNHADCDHWLKRFGKNMDWFRAKVKAIIDKPKEETFKPYMVRVNVRALNIRKGAGTNYGIAGVIRGKGVYTIVGEATGQGATKWGTLKSGAGWISLDSGKRI